MIAEKFYLFELGGVDLILGVSWLATLGEVKTNWKTLTMRFNQDAREVRIQGHPTLTKRVITPEALLKETEIEVVSVVWNMGYTKLEERVDDGEKLQPEQQAELEEILEDFEDIFQEPKGLPPNRLMNHRIPIKVGVDPVNELLDELNGATYFSKVDLKAGYHQIRMEEKDISKTTFCTHQGHYEFLVMSFGLSNAPATFQCLMNTVLRQFLRRCVLVFFDDILIYSNSWEEHRDHLKQVLQTLRQQQLYANKKKCDFGRLQIKYLGHCISRKGVMMDPEKIKAVKEWPEPHNIKDLRGFLGLSGYYRRFIKDYGKIAKPLTDLLRKGQFKWTSKGKAAMQTLKIALTSAPLLALPDFSQIFHVECDASGKEGTEALVLSIQHWGPYLLGKKFVVHTDQRSLRYLLEQRITTQNQKNWLAKLLGYEFEIAYRSGATNKVVDALSRQLEEPETAELELKGISRPFWQDFQEIMGEVQQDIVLQKIITDLDNNPDSHPNFTMEHDRLHYKGTMVLSAKSVWVQKLIAEFHVTQTGGHFGVFRTYRKLAQTLYWIGTKKDVTEFVASCLKYCDQNGVTPKCSFSSHSCTSGSNPAIPLPLPCAPPHQNQRTTHNPRHMADYRPPPPASAVPRHPLPLGHVGGPSWPHLQHQYRHSENRSHQQLGNGERVLQHKRNLPKHDLQPRHARIRTLRNVAFVFVADHRIDTLSHVRISEVRTLAKELYYKWKRGKTEKDFFMVDMTQWLKEVAFNVLLRMVAGKRYFGEKAVVDEEEARICLGMFKEYMRLFGVFMTGDAVPWLRRFDFGGHEKAMKENFTQLDAVVGEWLEEHKRKRKLNGEKGEKGGDFMESMLSDYNGTNIHGFDSDTIIKATTMALILGGPDTSFASNMWTLSLLLNNPGALKKVMEEIDTHIGKERLVTESDTNKLVYLHAVVKESLRLYPPTPLNAPREFREDCKLGEYHVKKGTRLITNLWKIQTDPKIWPEPLEFKLERFLTTHKDVDVKGKHFELIPFGSGRRICPRVTFGLKTSYLTLANFLHCFHVSKSSTEPIDMTSAVEFTNVKVTPLQLLIKPRLAPTLYESM
ncbi:hypothetical protein V8G54_012037 [Vigna mungo]|uniref:Reverse transcriptase domain-containing protein n=1 Tax=Vigna mungo TaxID=3915 RepID=A0AAQ3NQM6_VIGMU